MTLAAFAGATDTGKKRRRNEDAYVMAPPLFAVADGMGGAQAGEVASKLAATVLEDTDAGALSGRGRVVSLFQEANKRVYDRSHTDPSASGMGTTMTVALIEGNEVTIGHVGDSRAYLVRDGKLEQLTEDHSLVNELMKSGKLSPEEAEIHPQRSVITRALGTDPDVDVDAFTIEAHRGDVFLLCSDGLTSMVDDDGILAIVEEQRGNLEKATKSLVSAANKGGGEDNITVVAFTIADEDVGAETAEMTAVTEPEPEPEQDPEATPIPPRREVSPTARVRIVLTMLVLLAIAGALLVWGLLR